MIDPQHSYEIPASAYTGQTTDPVGGGDMCNIYIIGQSFSDVSYWTLGESFLRHHYVTFDASDSSQPRVGLVPSTTGPPVAPVQPESPPHWSGATALAAAASSLAALALAF